MGRYANSYALLKKLTYEDLMSIRDDDTMRLISHPFMVGYEDHAVVGKAVPWKGKRFRPRPGKPATITESEFEEKFPKIYKVIDEALRPISKECEGVTGSVRVGKRLLSRRNLCMMNLKGKYKIAEEEE